MSKKLLGRDVKSLDRNIEK